MTQNINLLQMAYDIIELHNENARLTAENQRLQKENAHYEEAIKDANTHGQVMFNNVLQLCLRGQATTNSLDFSTARINGG